MRLLLCARALPAVSACCMGSAQRERKDRGRCGGVYGALATAVTVLKVSWRPSVNGYIVINANVRLKVALLRGSLDRLA